MKILRNVFLGLIVMMLGVFIIAKKCSVNPPLKVFTHDYKGDLPLQNLKLPDGFAVEVYADSVTNARSMCFGSDNKVLFVGTRSEGKVYALVDENMDYKVDKQYVIYSGGNMPNGVAFKNKDLYVAEVNRVLLFRNIESRLGQKIEPEVVYDGYPNEKHHGWKYIAFGPDGKLYVPVGAPCNICESKDSIFNSITRLDIATKKVEIVHRGIRNTVGFDWDPVTNELWFTDNGRDMMGDDMPNCELNHAAKDGMHFGYPYCHQGDTPDPELGVKQSCDKFVVPAALMGPHTAPLGMEFYKGKLFPSDYENNVFVARHGSWNRSEKIGYDIVRVAKDNNSNVIKNEPFISGWLSEDKKDVWGRPVDIATCNDGSILISDDFADVIYRVYYVKHKI